MVALMSPLVEYLLAWQRDDGTHLVKWGDQVSRVDVFPPNTTILYDLYPSEGYANIYFYNTWTKLTIPDAFLYEANLGGVLVVDVTATEMMFGEHNLWLEVTYSTPLHVRITNQSNVSQYFEAGDTFLIVYTEKDLTDIHNLIKNYTNSRITNQLLDRIATKQGA